MRDTFRRIGIEIGNRVLAVGFREAEELKAIAERVGFNRVEAFLVRARRTM